MACAGSCCCWSHDACGPPCRDAQLAWHAGGGSARFAYTHFVAPDELPAGEGARVHALDAVMRDAARAETACVVPQLV